jgi:hypothetical protein
MNISQIQAELLRREYPHLLPNEDPDIERYFFLRNSGRSQDALNLYQSRLKPRYPNDEFRTILLRLYRHKSPAYRELQAKAYQALGARCLERMKRLIGFVADRADSYNPRDVYSTIKAAELIKQVLPPERYEAMAAMERFFRYAQVLNLRIQSIHRAMELIRAYLSDTLTVVDEERRKREDAQKRAVDERRRRLSDFDVSTYGWQNKPAPLSNLMDAVVFSPADLAHIEIPRTIIRLEDKTLAYCAKYWIRTEDQSFERILFLYSRKYGAKNYDIFKAIQRGKQNDKRDDEILASVMSSLITGYYYSVMGDRYIQRQWAAIKAKLLSSLVLTAAPKPAPVPKAPAIPAAPVTVPKPAAVPAVPVRPIAVPRPAIVPAAAVMPRPVPSAARPVVVPTMPVAPPPARPAAPVRPAAVMPRPAAPPAARPAAWPAVSAASLRPAAPLKPAAPRPEVPPEATETPGSVSQRLRELSGRSYDVFQDRFLAHARPAIRKVLGANRGLFFNVPTQAEDLVFNFLKAHYDDPYMNWEESEERTGLSKTGFDLDSVIPVIDECYKML